MSALSEKPNAETLPAQTGASILLDGHYLPPPKDSDGKLWVRTTALVQSTPEELYRLWRSIEYAPLWQEEIDKVIVTGEKTSRWTMRSGDKTITWDSEVLADEPGQRITWRSIGGEFENAGEVIFEASPANRGTVVIVLQEFRMGKVSSAWETFVGRNPKQAVIESLRHFKALAETGEIPRSQEAPHGKRGLIAGFKRSMYGEKITTPPGAKVI